MKLLQRLTITACLILVFFNTPAIAQPYSFPVCLGDASSWHMQVRDPNRTFYTPPLIQTMSVDRDTLAYGKTYFHANFPEQLSLPAIWVRSDSMGLHYLTAAGDSLLFPATEQIGTPVLGGEITNTLTVNTMSGKTRAYRIARVDSTITRTWIVADGIGVWGFMSWEEDNNENVYCRFLSGRRCGQGPAGDPIAIDVPLGAGDILVRSREDGPSIIESARNSMYGPYWVGLPASSALWFEKRSFSVTINTDCNVLYEPQDFMGSARESEYYPAYIPASDTILLDGNQWSVERRFDTTVFSQPVRAFAIRGETRWGEFVRIIAEKFGVVREIAMSSGYYSSTTALASAVVNGVAYNRNTERHRFFPICSNSIYEYRMFRSPDETVARTTLTRDTVVDGQTFTFFRLPGIPYKPGQPSEKSLVSGWFRETEEGIYSIDSTLAYPFAADLGDITHSGIVTGINQQVFGNESRYVLVTSDRGYHYDRSDTLVEGVGPIFSRDSRLFEGGFRWELIGAIICGEPWGIPLAVSETPLPPEQAAMQLYPNPVPLESAVIHVSVTGIRGDKLQLSLHDLLGRECRNHHLEYAPPGSDYTLTLGNLPAGMYVLRLQTDRSTVSKNLLLLR